jgi:diacylglycerol kinase family enzyme
MCGGFSPGFLTVFPNLSYAGGATPFEKAKFNDGKLDIILFKKLWAFMVIGGISRVFPRCYRWIIGFIRIYQATSLEIINPGPEYMQLDGEDVSGKFSKEGLKILPSGRVLLLDLRRPPFEIF